MNTSKLEASIGLSRKWDAREAGREVVESAIKNLNRPPNFFVLFSTIHYEKHGGFQELLNGVFDILPHNTPLIGGTVSGFSNNYGVYARGATALAVSYPHMDVAIGYGKNTKRNPKKAARQCAKMIKESLKDSKYENKFLLNLISGSILPDIPFIGRKKVIKSKIFTTVLLKLFGFSEYLFQKGYGRDDEVVEEMIKQLPEFKMLSGGTIDDGSAIENYQFFNKNLLTNSIVTLGLSTDYQLDVRTTHNMKKTDITFNITKSSRDGRIIYKINNRPAVTEFLNILDWHDSFLTEDNWFNVNYYFPLGFPVNNEKDFGPRLLGAIYGESFITLIRSKEPLAPLLTIDGESILKAIDINLESYPKPPEFGLISSCSTRLETLEGEVYKSRERIEKFFNGKPYIKFYVGGESTYSPDKGLHYANMSFNTAIFWK